MPSRTRRTIDAAFNLQIVQMIREQSLDDSAVRRWQTQ